MKQICILIVCAAAMVSCSRGVAPESTTPSMVFRVCDQNRWNCRTPPPDILAALNAATDNGPIELSESDRVSTSVGERGAVMIPPGTGRARGHIVPRCEGGAVAPSDMAAFVNWMNRTFPGGRSQACGGETYDWHCEGPWTEVTDGGVLLCRWIYEPEPLGPDSTATQDIQQDFSGTRF